MMDVGNVKQISFAQRVFAGDEQWLAAQTAGYGNRNRPVNKKALGATAARLMRVPAVVAELQRLRNMAAVAACGTRSELLNEMWKVLRWGEDCDRVQAAKVVARIEGWEAPKKIDMGGNLSRLTDAELQVRYEAAKQRRALAVPVKRLEQPV